MTALISLGRFTLIQCRFAIAVVLILVAVALPALHEYTIRSHREEARAALMRTTRWMEQTASSLGRYPGHRMIPPEVLTVESGRYVISAQSLSGLEFTLTATPTAEQSDDECGAYRVNQMGARIQLATEAVPVPLGPLECWEN